MKTPALLRLWLAEPSTFNDRGLLIVFYYILMQYFNTKAHFKYTLGYFISTITLLDKVISEKKKTASLKRRNNIIRSFMYILNKIGAHSRTF